MNINIYFFLRRIICFNSFCCSYFFGLLVLPLRQVYSCFISELVEVKKRIIRTNFVIYENFRTKKNNYFLEFLSVCMCFSRWIVLVEWLELKESKSNCRIEIVISPKVTKKSNKKQNFIGVTVKWTSSQTQMLFQCKFINQKFLDIAVVCWL